MIWISQWLCPERHCVFALTWSDGLIDGSSESAEREGKRLISESHPDGDFCCGMCGSDQITISHDKTRFETMEEAKPHLEKSQTNQLITRLLTDRWKGEHA